MALNVQQRIEGAAFAMLGLSPEQRHQCFCEAFDQVLAKHPDLAEVPPSIVVFVAAVMERVAELEQQVGRA
jgi:hypothetical protein